MKSDRAAPTTIDDYIAGFPHAVQKVLEQMRITIRQAAPSATEAIKYGLPTFVLEGNLVHFGAFQKHLGFYSLPSGHRKFQDELSVYVGGKGSVQFPLDQPMPLGLVRRIVRFRVAENRERAAAKRRKKH